MQGLKEREDGAHDTFTKLTSYARSSLRDHFSQKTALPATAPRHLTYTMQVLGSGAGVGFDKNGPYIRNRRILEGWRESLLKGFRGGGGWQILTPHFLDTFVP